ncbi:MAG TPA: hypothetical protein VNO31_22755 [Umezawaea sp.]|nr:hypothetical protein [Umezawaea sp.]
MNVNTAATARKKKIEKYFHKTPNPNDNVIALAFLTGGGVLALVGLVMFAGGNAFFGVVLLAGAGYLGYQGFVRKSAYDRAHEASTPKPTAREMDRLLLDDLLKIERTAMAQLDLTSEDLQLETSGNDPFAALAHGSTSTADGGRRPLVVFGPAVNSGFAIGEDDVWRCKRYEVMVICPTSYHMAIYRCVLDFLTGGMQSVETHEYHYADVVAVSTNTRPAPDLVLDILAVIDEEQVRFARTLLKEFQIVVSSGDRSKVVVGISDEEDPDNSATLQDSGINRVIDTVRKVLRDKKGGTAALN